VRWRGSWDAVRFRHRNDLAEACRGRRSQLARKSCSNASTRASAPRIADRDQAADQQLVMAFFQRVQLEQARGQARRGPRISRAELGCARFEEQRLRGGGQVAAFDQQPRLERRAGRERHSLEQLAGERSISSAFAERPSADATGRSPRRLEGTLDRIAAQRLRLLHRLPQLREAPPQRAQRILRLREEQLRERLSARRAPRERR